MTLAAACVAAFALSALTVWLARGIANRRGWLDRPNSRSSHESPTPRLGGIGVWLATLAVSSIAALVGQPPALGDTYLWAVLLGALLVAVTGLADDLLPQGLVPAVKLAGQLAAALATIAVAREFFLGSTLPEVTNSAAGLFLVVTLVGSFQVLWLTAQSNFANFMDGSDGLLAGISIIGLVCLASLLSGADSALAGSALVAAAATIGLLVFNRPRASIFMGDSGSLFLGFLLAALAMAWIATGAGPRAIDAAMPGPQSLYRLGTVLILMAPLWVDAVTTLLLRLIRRRHLTEAHRDHLYQRMLRAGMTPAALCLVYWTYAVACGGAAIVSATHGLLGGVAGLALVAGGVIVVVTSHRRSRLIRNASGS